MSWGAVVFARLVAREGNAEGGGAGAGCVNSYVCGSSVACDRAGRLKASVVLGRIGICSYRRRDASMQPVVQTVPC